VAAELIGVCGGLIDQEQAVMVVPLVMLIDWYRGRRLALWALFGFVALNFLVLRQALTGSHLAAGILASPGELKLRLIAIAQVLVTDVRILFWPYDLHYYRSTDILTASPWWWVPVILAGVLLFES